MSRRVYTGQTPDTCGGDDWRQRAACTDEDPELFFAWKPGGGYTQARRVCQHCPVRRACLDAAMGLEAGLDAPRRHGMWGNTVPETRAELARCESGRCRHERLGDHLTRDRLTGASRA